MREWNKRWLALLTLAAIVGTAGCTGNPERLPQCRGEATPIKLPAITGGAERGG